MSAHSDSYVGSRSHDLLGIVLRVAVVVLTLATAYIHNSLGGWMFTANAIGYVVLAVLMIAPIAYLSRYRWLVRVALLGFTVTTIVAWFMFGGRFFLAYADKAIEVGLVAALLTEMLRYDGGPIGVLRRLIGLGVTIVRLPFAKRRFC
jgi:hypothetical protein